MPERDEVGHAGKPHGGGSQNSLAEFFAPGIIPQDVPQFFPLFAAKPLIGAMIALFRGGDEEVLVRLVVLREIGLRADAPDWSPRELESHFAFFASAKLNTVLGRLREHELLLWNAERRVYRLSSAGRMVLAALSNLLSFSAEQDGELGFYAAQIAAGSAVGKLSPEAMAHLLARLAELEGEFEQAVTSGSEFRLRAAQNKLESVQQWMNKANEVMKNLGAAGFPDDATWRLAQEIGNRQSRLDRMSSIFQRELAAIARQQVHLSQGGLTTSELASWLKERSIDELVALAGNQLAISPEATFILPDVMIDNTEEFIERDQPSRRTSLLPPPAEIEYARDVPLESPPQLAELTLMLQAMQETLAAADAVVGGNFSAASYRLSLLTFIGEQNVDPELAPLAALPLAVRWDSRRNDLIPVHRNEVAAISAGELILLKEKSA
ncbi:MAG: hypothetical protein A3H31_00300 [Gallionellales bacterium RIFCSPLOWO2_02_FULL_57_47]|nr:MAG: hypothetical protein A3H31_00300 [Gallionellales bacterium RIFCSPLOWO2_02_FULL_57_47]OGT14197.1 MAG: hypothetical protein A3J49_06850 [Gallionellales bacterium RIFCSPHIGHO2_02_FULL_57_16]